MLAVRMLIDSEGLRRNDVFLCGSRCYWGIGFVVLTQALLRGATTLQVVDEQRLSPMHTLAAADEGGATLLFGVASMYQGMLRGIADQAVPRTTLNSH